MSMPRHLTPRENELLRVAAHCDDTGDKALSELLHISRKTVDTHFENIKRKMAVKSRTAAVVRWLKEHAI